MPFFITLLFLFFVRETLSLLLPSFDAVTAAWYLRRRQVTLATCPLDGVKGPGRRHRRTLDLYPGC